MRKRPLVGIAVLFLAGILAFAYKINIAVTGTIFVLLSTAALFYKRKMLPFIAVLTISFFAGSMRMYFADNHREDVLSQFSSRTLSLTMTVTDFSCDGKATVEFKQNGRAFKMYLKTESESVLSPGDVIKADVYIYEPYTSKIDMSDYSMYLASNGVYLCGKTDFVKLTGRKTDGVDGMFFSIRRYIDNIGAKSFSGNARGLFNAMVLGDKRFLTDEFSSSLQKAGLSHIAAVSGMHLSIIIALQMMLVGKIFGKKRGASVVSVAGAIFITVITGAGASVVRACAMCVIFCLSRLVHRESDAMSSLMLAVLVLLGVNPYFVFNAGFVLSVLSVLGILVYGDKIKAFTCKFLGGPAGEAVAICLSAQLAVTIPVMYYFGVMTPYSVISNLAVTVFASAIVTSSILFTCISQLPVISEIVAAAVKFSSEAIGIVCRAVEALPGALRNTGAVRMGLIAGWVFLLCILYPKKANARYTMKIFALSAVIFFSGSCMEISNHTDLRMNFVSYGGETMTTAFFDGEAILIDCPDSSDAINIAESNNLQSYKYTVMSGKATAGAKKLVKNNKAGAVITYGPYYSEKEKANLTKEFESVGGEVVFLGKGQRFCFGKVSICYADTGEENIPALPEVEYKGVRLVSLQGLSSVQIKTLSESGFYISCDYLKVSSDNVNNVEELRRISEGKLLKDEKSLSLNLK